MPTECNKKGIREEIDLLKEKRMASAVTRAIIRQAWLQDATVVSNPENSTLEI